MVNLVISGFVIIESWFCRRESLRDKENGATKWNVICHDHILKKKKVFNGIDIFISFGKVYIVL